MYSKLWQLRHSRLSFFFMRSHSCLASSARLALNFSGVSMVPRPCAAPRWLAWILRIILGPTPWARGSRGRWRARRCGSGSGWCCGTPRRRCPSSRGTRCRTSSRLVHSMAVLKPPQNMMPATNSMPTPPVASAHTRPNRLSLLVVGRSMSELPDLWLLHAACALEGVFHQRLGVGLGHVALGAEVAPRADAVQLLPSRVLEVGHADLGGPDLLGLRPGMAVHALVEVLGDLVAGGWCAGSAAAAARSRVARRGRVPGAKPAGAVVLASPGAPPRRPCSLTGFGVGGGWALSADQAQGEQAGGQRQLDEGAD
jgi:hypothetical protein